MSSYNYNFTCLHLFGLLLLNNHAAPTETPHPSHRPPFAPSLVAKAADDGMARISFLAVSAIHRLVLLMDRKTHDIDLSSVVDQEGR